MSGGELTKNGNAPSPPVASHPAVSLPRGFVGTHERGIDAKLRVVLPSQFRDKLLGHTLIMMKWVKRSLVVYPECNWLPLAERIHELDLYDEDGLSVRHHFFAHACEINMDKKEGRIVIPDDMAEYARLKDVNKIMILGDFDKFTIWNAVYYKDQLAIDDTTFSEKLPGILKLARSSGRPINPENHSS